MKRLYNMRGAILAVFVAGAILLTGCVQTANTTTDGTNDDTEVDTQTIVSTVESEEPDNNGSDTRIYTDSLGREVEVPTEVTSVVVTGSLGQMVILSLAPDLLLGLSSAWDESAMEYLAEEYYNLPVLGALYSSSGEINLEELLALDPDVIIDIGETSSSLADELDELQGRTGLPFVHIESSLATTTQMYTMLGDLLGMEEEARILADYCADIYATTEALLAEVGEDTVSVVYCLGDTGTNIIGANSYHSEIIDMMSKNAAVIESPSSKGTGDAVDFEQLLLWNPDVILFASGSVYDEVGTSELWNQLSAISSGQYYEVPYGPYNWIGMPPSIQRYLGLLWLSEVLYPTYTTVDLQEAVCTCFELFYHCELTDAQYQALVANSLG